MTPGQIAAWAREVGATTRHYSTLLDGRSLFLGADFTPEKLARFAALVAAHERERCAQIADDHDPSDDVSMCDTAEQIAHAIRNS